MRKPKAQTPPLTSPLTSDAVQALANAAQALAQVLQLLAVPQGPHSLTRPPVEDKDWRQTVSAPHPCELTLSELVNQFLVAKCSLGRSDRYLRQVKSSLSGFLVGRAKLPAAEVSPDLLAAWVESLDVAPRTVRGYLSDWRTVFGWAVRRGWLSDNPAARVDPPALASEREIEVHTPDEVRKVLEWAFRSNADVGRHLAVRYFAGVRSAEAHRLREDAIQKDRGVIEVSAARSKTRSRRLVTIQPALSAWLELGGTLRGISPNTIKAALKGCPVAMPHNVTRHSFVSYHLAAFGSAGRTAMEAGHSEAMLFRHYRALVPESAAAEFWALRPPR